MLMNKARRRRIILARRKRKHLQKTKRVRFR